MDTFRLAGAGVQNFEKTVAGTEAKLSMLGQKLTQQNRAVEQYSRALVAANDKLKENYDRHKDYSARLEQAKARQEALRFEVETSKVAYEHYRDTLGETDSATIAAKQNLERYLEEHAEATAEVTKLEGQVKALQKTMQNSADTASKAATDLNNAKAAARDTEAEIKRLTEQLYRMQSASMGSLVRIQLSPPLGSPCRLQTICVPFLCTLLTKKCVPGRGTQKPAGCTCSSFIALPCHLQAMILIQTAASFASGKAPPQERKPDIFSRPIGAGLPLADKQDGT